MRDVISFVMNSFISKFGLITDFVHNKPLNHSLVCEYRDTMLTEVAATTWTFQTLRECLETVSVHKKQTKKPSTAMLPVNYVAPGPVPFLILTPWTLALGPES